MVVVSQLITWWFIAISWILGILCIYFTSIYYKLREELILKKRHGWITLLISYFAIFSLIISWPLILLNSIIDINDIKTHKILGVFIAVLTAPVLYIMFFLVMLRYWAIAYDFSVNRAISNIEWKQLINTKNEWSTERWILKNKECFGNDIKLFNYGIIFSIALSIISGIFWILKSVNYMSVFDFIAPIYDAIWLILFVLFVIFIRTCTPKFIDSLHINAELKHITRFYLLCIIGFVSIIVLEYLDIYTYNLSRFIGILSCFISSFLPIIWLFYCIKNKLNDQDKSTKISNYIEDNNVHHFSLKATLTTKNLYEPFMHHLQSEMSMESLLAFTEFEQYRLYSQKLFSRQRGIGNRNLSVYEADEIDEIDKHDYAVNDDNDSDYDIAYTTFIFPNNTPKSYIVYNHDIKYDDIIEELKDKSHQLYNKYIRIGSRFEVNLSYVTRESLARRLSNRDGWYQQNISNNELIDIFKRAKKEVYHLMADNHRRFMYTKVFNRAHKSSMNRKMFAMVISEST